MLWMSNTRPVDIYTPRFCFPSISPPRFGNTVTNNGYELPDRQNCAIHPEDARVGLALSSNMNANFSDVVISNAIRRHG